jgi:hypothetical protein
MSTAHSLGQGGGVESGADICIPRPGLSGHPVRRQRQDGAERMAAPNPAAVICAVWVCAPARAPSCEHQVRHCTACRDRNALQLCVVQRVVGCLVGR